MPLLPGHYTYEVERGPEHSRASGALDVTRYGAVPDDEAYDDVAVQMAIDAAQALFPPDLPRLIDALADLHDTLSRELVAGSGVAVTTWDVSVGHTRTHSTPSRQPARAASTTQRHKDLTRRRRAKNKRKEKEF